MTLALVHEAFDQAKADVRDATDRLTKDRADVDAKVSSFLGAGWTGVAADSFVDAWDSWKLAATDVLDGLIAMNELLVAAHADYIEQDDASQRRLDAVASRIVERLG